MVGIEKTVTKFMYNQAHVDDGNVGVTVVFVFCDGDVGFSVGVGAQC